MSQLDELKRITTVVADSGDIEAVRRFQPQDATTNPSLILKAAAIPQYQPLIDDALDYALTQGGSQETQIINASDKLAVNIGLELLRQVPGCPPLIRPWAVRGKSAETDPFVSAARD